MTGLAEQISCVEREIKLRQRVYGRLVASDRMSAEKSAAEIATMEAVLLTLRELEAKERLL